MSKSVSLEKTDSEDESQVSPFIPISRQSTISSIESDKTDRPPSVTEMVESELRGDFNEQLKDFGRTSPVTVEDKTDLEKNKSKLEESYIKLITDQRKNGLMNDTIFAKWKKSREKRGLPTYGIRGGRKRKRKTRKRGGMKGSLGTLKNISVKIKPGALERMSLPKKLKYLKGLEAERELEYSWRNEYVLPTIKELTSKKIKTEEEKQTLHEANLMLHDFHDVIRTLDKEAKQVHDSINIMPPGPTKKTRGGKKKRKTRRKTRRKKNKQYK